MLDGEGPPVFLMAAESGRVRLATLDAAGRLLAVAVGDEPIWSVFDCPGGRLLLEVTEEGVVARDVVMLDHVKKVEFEEGQGPEQIWCLDESVKDMLGLFPEADGTGMRLQKLGDAQPLHVGEYY